MALGLYTAPDASALLTDKNPFTVTFDGRKGGIINRLLFVRNDNSATWYSNIQVQPIDLSGENIVDGSKLEFHWKLLEKDIVPALEEWKSVLPGNQLTLSSNLGSSTLGDIVTFLPFWVQVKIPERQKVSTIKDVVFRVTATESLV